MLARRPRPVFPPCPCLVEGCRNQTTRHGPAGEGSTWIETGKADAFYICSTHWRLVPKVLKRRDRRLIRHWKRICPTRRYWDYPGGSRERLKTIQVERLIRENWSRIERAARGEVVALVDGVPSAMADDLRRLGL